MADKEATVYIVDLGSSMGDCHNGRTESDLDWSMRYAWDKISATVAASRKTWNIGVIGVRTDETVNPLAEDDGYNNISVLQELGPMNMTAMESLQSKIKPSGTSCGDSVSAIVVAIQMIEKLTKKLKYKRNIILITDGEAPVDPDDDNLNDIADKIKDTQIQLTVLGVDFDDSEFGIKEEDKTAQKATNERLLRQLAGRSGGNFGTIAEAIAELDIPRLKQTRPFKSYDGPLTLGDPQVDPRAMSISVERYFKTHKQAPPPASNVILKTDHASGSQSAQTRDVDRMQGVEPTGGAFASVKNARAYKVNDPDTPGGKKDVEFDCLAKGYQYGSTAVHISESEFNITKIETAKCFTIVGFIHQDKYGPFLNMGSTGLTVAQKLNDAAAMKLSSLIHSLHELESYAVARIVTKDGKEPQLLLLAPYIDVDFECLYDIPLPFAEDVRSYHFPPLDKVITVAGATLTKHRHLPTQDLIETMSEYVDAMDISTFGLDDEGQRTQEYAPVEDVYCPPVHRINQVVRHRVIYADQPVPPIPPILLKYAQPNRNLVEKARSALEDLIEVAEVKQVPPKAKGKRQRDAIKPISGLDVDALLQTPENKRTKIDPNNAVPEFKQMVDNAEDIKTFEEATKQIGHIIRQLITDSLGDVNYDRAIEVMGVLRESLINIEEPGFYNSFIKDLKKRLLSGELGGDRRELWWQVKGAKLGLIDQNMSDVSKVTPEEVAEFYKK
ncbi:putative Ku family DNA helicase [Pseudomassariella vexata]|uniref:ATP-dependent DNA helicase II subunit 2 n=1 Tax=Pseudomassariella vexata TaxID=1141098 RepID=A0A1Y2EEZ8_9PEZI|nr:putative Ku family DNA helicase [Pseudomassariella vexata]ORY70158.1 putative Ku family DNA helicase [Pseudomassariella vexata]